MSTSKREQLGQIVIRPPEGMRQRIKAAADANNRSMNAEIVAALEEKFPAPDPWDDMFESVKGWLRTLSNEDRRKFIKEYLEGSNLRVEDYDSLMRDARPAPYDD